MHRARSTLYLAMCVVAGAVACNNDTPATPRAKSIVGPSFTTGNPINTGSQETYTLAVIGDFPYGDAKIADMPGLFALINGDPKVDLVTHLGDIKAGTHTFCTDEYFDMIRQAFDTFKDPLVYMPGDNEWVDCHQDIKDNGFYLPTERLEKVREDFFPVAGQTLGGRRKQVLTQADDPDNAAYVENVMWMESRVVFASFNVQGSNDDKASWGTALPPLGTFQSQNDERASRSRANSAWLEKTFQTAAEHDAAGVVLMMQADMWDATASLNGFDDFVNHIGNLAAAFGKPVLLLEGDSHSFRVDQPYTAASTLHGLHPSTPIAPNLTRIVVEGSDKGRTEYLRLTVDPKKGDLFSWERVPLH